MGSVAKFPLLKLAVDTELAKICDKEDTERYDGDILMHPGKITERL